MKLRAGFILLFLLGGCAGYKELEPDPPVLPAERGYVELKKDAENFELDKDGKYFIKFPPPGSDHFFLVVSSRSLSVLKTSLTNLFEGDDKSIVRIPRADLSNDTLGVYPIDPGPVSYYWLIESVPYDLQPEIRYRYVPQWRFTFERKFAGYREVLDWYSVDRTTYNAIDEDFDTDGLEFQKELTSVQEKNSRISAMMAELLKLEEVFPPGIAASGDTAYASYTTFRGKVEEELEFQQMYTDVLTMFQKEMSTRGSPSAFLQDVPYYTAAISHHDKVSPGVRSRACQLITTRLSEIGPYLNKMLIGKNDLSRITPIQPVDTVQGLYRTCGQTMPGETEQVLRFANRFNVEVDGIAACKASIEGMKSYFASLGPAPPDTALTELARRADVLRTQVPASQASRMPGFANYACATMLAREVANTANTATDLQAIFQDSRAIERQVALKAWGPAEAGLKGLFELPLASTSQDVASQKRMLVGMFEDDIFAAVKKESHARIDTFTTRHAMAIENVPALYADSAFVPVYRLTFSSRGPAGLAEKLKQVDGYIDSIKHVQFPATSIRSIYSSLTGNIRDRGVEKARAIVEHGKFYEGTDNQIKNMIAECNVDVPKLMTKPKEYRKFYALPVSSNSQGENEYMFRLALRIPSDAEFPVFDVNIKLPEDIARKAGERQWYESVTINNKEIRNEGRFSITSPTADNNYEILITPVQMDKAEKNVLEVRFRYPGFQVFEISAMAQVPIIRKH